MSLLDQILLWLKNIDNDLVAKLLAALATPGGIWFWIDKYRNRVRIRIRKLKLADTSGRRIAFEAENVSSLLTSLEPTFLLTGYSPEKKKQTYRFTIEGNGHERQLPAHVLRQVVAGHNARENLQMLSLWYMILTVPLTRGGRVRVRIRNVEFEPIRFSLFHWERMRFLLLGKVPD